LLVYKTFLTFVCRVCILHLYWIWLTDLVLADILEFLLHKIMWGRDSSNSSFLIRIPFISFSCLIALSRASIFTLKRRGKRKHLCLVTCLRENPSSMRMTLAVGLSYMVLLWSATLFLNLIYWEDFFLIMKWCLILSNTVCIFNEMIMYNFGLYSTDV
jgi:hypothetical protein